MKARDLKLTVKKLALSKVPLFIWGSPGIGKSSIVKQVADELGVDFLDLRLTLMDPTDLKGIPFFDKDSKKAVWASPSFLPSDPNSKGILFLDEINSAPPSVQASAYQLILDRKVGEYELPKDWSIVAAGNNESDRGVVYRMASPLANRFVHIDMEVSFEDWKAWAYESGISDEVIGFLSYKQEYLFRFDPNLNEKAFATPRSWEYVHHLLNSDLNDLQLFETIKGAVGTEVATEFFSFKKVLLRLPSIEDILDGKIKEIDDEPELLFALISSIVSHLLRDSDPMKITNALKFSYSLPSEFAVMLAKDLEQNEIDLQKSSEWENWVENFSHLL